MQCMCMSGRGLTDAIFILRRLQVAIKPFYMAFGDLDIHSMCFRGCHLLDNAKCVEELLVN